ncbi:MAG: conjugal transfer protein TraX [Clostridia bacterium]|nr:conjugal transfer protein TraX [Clostridia bacterium]
MSERRFGISSSTLHIIGMIFMLCDHLWATVIPGNDWLTCVGRLTYPIFAFLVVEGYFHTSNLRRYLLRMGIFALISEIPFNLMYGGSVIYPVHQSVMCTLLIGLVLIILNEAARKKNKLWLTLITAVCTVLLGALLGVVTFTDYSSVGVLTILVFYFFRKRNIWHFLLQLVCLYYLNAEVLQGMYFTVELFGKEFEIVRQSLAVLSLIPIWLYNGKKGIRSKVFRYFCYAFYPAHMLVLWIIKNTDIIGEWFLSL